RGLSEPAARASRTLSGIGPGGLAGRGRDWADRGARSDRTRSPHAPDGELITTAPFSPPGRGCRPQPRQRENPSPGARPRPTGVGEWFVPRRLDRRSGFEALASDLGLEGRADRLIEPRRLAGGLLLSFLLDERIPLLRQLEDLLANLPALLDL